MPRARHGIEVSLDSKGDAAFDHRQAARAHLDRLTALQLQAALKVQRARGVWTAEALKELELDLDALTYAVSLLELLDRAAA